MLARDSAVRVVVAGRSQAKAESAVREVRAARPDADILALGASDFARADCGSSVPWLTRIAAGPYISRLTGERHAGTIHRSAFGLRELR